MMEKVTLHSAEALYQIEKANDLLSDVFVADDNEASYRTLAVAKVELIKAKRAILKILTDGHIEDLKD